MGAAVALDGRRQGRAGPGLLVLCGGGDHGCSEVTKLLPSGIHCEGGRLSWVCLSMAVGLAGFACGLR